MKISNIEREFPADVYLNFQHLISGIKEKSKSIKGLQREYYDKVIALMDENLWLSQNISKEELPKRKDVIKEIVELMFPKVLEDNELKMFTMPWDFIPIFQSTRMESLIKSAGKDFDLNFSDFSDDQLYISGCTYILAKHYEMFIPYSRPYVFDIPDESSGKITSYRMTLNGDYLDLEPTEKSIEITEEIFNELIDNYDDVNVWKKYFPPNSWKFTGFTLVNLMNVQNDTLVNRITEHLLNADPEGFEQLRLYISEFLGFDVDISFVNMQGPQFLQPISEQHNRLMMGDNEVINCDELLCEYSYQELLKNKRPIAVPNIPKFAKKSDSLIAKNLKKTGRLSYYAAPVMYEDEILGIMELGASEKGLLNKAIGAKLQELLPIISVAARRFKQEFDTRIEAVIQEECTSIHPSVKWRFEIEAMKHISAVDSGEVEHHFDDLVFPDVYPLFGQLDIRGSSTIRNEGIKNDLLTQLLGARDILEKAKKIKKLPIYSELTFVIDSLKSELKDGLVSSSEQSILRFLNKELDPILKEIATKDGSLEKAYAKYEGTLHPEFRFVYKERKAFDDAVNTINRKLAQYIDEKQDEAQEMFPHYFERYKTDGLEFNMYIGESITPDAGFHPLLVKNLRLWQLIVMLEMEQEMHTLRSNMEKPLQVASLVLAFNSSLSIQFRMDEKRFDVEGAYNARYEIIKKRIDKAHIKDTDIRITEPGKMVVVYSGSEEEKEYRRYYQFLASKGHLVEESFEIVQLEDLQGVTGLKAIRADILYPESPSNVGIKEIIEEIEGKKTVKK
ncbi:MAG: GAF domain-containing protein [Bacteroidota bacterium]